MAMNRHLTTMPQRLTANACFGSVLAVIGATTTAFTTTGTPAVSHDGIVTVLTTQTNTALAALAAADLPSGFANYLQPSGRAGFYVQPANTTVYYVIGVTAGGAWRVVQGTHDGQVLSELLGISERGRSFIPDVPTEGFTPVAVMKVVTGATTFTPGTTALNAANVTTTFRNVTVLPAAPQPF